LRFWWSRLLKYFKVYHELYPLSDVSFCIHTRADIYHSFLTMIVLWFSNRRITIVHQAPSEDLSLWIRRQISLNILK
jgi:hypothetical protein